MQQSFIKRFFAVFFPAALFCLFPILTPAQSGPPTVPDQTLDAGLRKAAIADIIKLVRENYVFEDVANKIAADLESRTSSGEYDKITSAKELAEVMTQNLRAVGHDKHLYLRLTPGSQINPFTPERMRAGNYGLSKAEILPGNVGYLKINEFPPPELVSDTLAAAMRFLNNTDAMIVDLRDHRGGSVETVALTVSYFMPGKRVRILTSNSPRTGASSESWTLEKLAGPRYAADKPVYLLTGAKTFSGGEEFAYDMQAFKRATLIGETTGGGANPVRIFPVQKMFGLGVAIAQVKNSITGTNWEGTGVKPDLEVPAGEALQKAQEIAASQLQKSRPANQTAFKTAPEEKSSTSPSVSNPAFPETPVGKILAAFFEALNSGELEKIKKFHAAFDAPAEAAENAGKDYGLYHETGGLTLTKISRASEYSITVVAKMKNSDRWLNFTMSVEEKPPYRISNIMIQPASKP